MTVVGSVETEQERVDRWAREDAAAVTRREQSALKAKRRGELKPDSKSTTWAIHGFMGGRQVWLRRDHILTGNSLGSVWLDQVEAKRECDRLRRNLRDQLSFGGVLAGGYVFEQVTAKGTRVERVLEPMGRELWRSLTLQSTTTEEWNVTGPGWEAVQEYI